MNYEYYNPNPKKRVRRDGTPMKWHKGDCTTRALAKALDLSWKDTFKLQCEKAMERSDAVGSKDIIEAILLEHGFKKGKINPRWVKQNHRRPMFKELLEYEFLKDMTIVGSMRRHIAAAVNGTVYDVWDCSNQKLYTFWYKKTETNE